MDSSKENAHEVIEPIAKDGRGATDTGPRNLPVDRQNPDILTPPSTDRGTVEAHSNLNGTMKRALRKEKWPVVK
ncbi:MAG: hypothetical protein OK442_04230 [Thaumarchaeota archaeon]|nr:hypothetical protein [Nitrososphaerota archaeon]